MSNIHILQDTAILTILIELPLFFLCGYRKSSQLLTFVLVNYVSNRLLNDALPNFTPELSYWFKLCLGELLVVAFEYAAMLHIINQKRRKLLFIICFTNCISLILGLVLLF